MEKINGNLFFWVSSLAFLGGAMNTFAILEFSITASHITGSLSRISAGIVSNNGLQFEVVFVLIISFFLGAVTSGMIIGSGRAFELKKRYGDTFIFIGISLLFLDYFIINKMYFVGILAYVLGVQNGLFISYKGMVTRTTHMTGTVTDLGVVIGNYLRGNREMSWKIKYYSITLTSFIVGGLMTGIGFKFLGRNILNLISILYIISGVYYFVLRHRYYKFKKLL